MDVIGQIGAVGLEHRPEHPVRAGQRAHRGDQLVAHPGDQEAAEAAGAVRDPQRGVAGAGQLARGVDQPLQDLVHRQLRGDGQHGVADRLQRGAEPAPA